MTRKRVECSGGCGKKQWMEKGAEWICAECRKLLGKRRKA